MSRQAPGASRPHSMSQASNAFAMLSSRASSARSGRSGGGTAWTIGSTWTIRAPGSTSRIAFAPAIAIRAQRALELALAALRERIHPFKIAGGR